MQNSDRLFFVLGSLLICMLAGCATHLGRAPNGSPEVRGTWITTTANTAISTPENTAKTMKRLRKIGLNTVYVEVWKNGYTQFPSEVMQKFVGVSQRPVGERQDPSDNAEQNKTMPRDLLQETLIEAHRNGLITVAWFEYGFMAAHQSTMPYLRRIKPELLSRDINGSEIAPNGFVWLNPLHPDARKLMLDIVLEAVDKYDLDGIQLDDRIVWPYINMGYDEYTKKIYAREHNGAAPPRDHKDAGWMRWRAEKVNEYARQFVQEIRAKRPGLLISLSPAVYPWSWEHYLLEWPQWAAWSEKDRNMSAAVSDAAKKITPRWDEFIPQAYRFSYDAFEKTWLEQNEFIKMLGANRQRDLIAGIRVVGDGNDSSWAQLRDSILLTRKMKNGGHVLWFSRGVLDVYPAELTDFYAGHVPSPQFPARWREQSLSLFRAPGLSPQAGTSVWFYPDMPPGDFRLIGFDGKTWQYLNDSIAEPRTNVGAKTYFYIRENVQQVELVRDRRISRRGTQPDRDIRP
jgi:hypothetical protein